MFRMISVPPALFCQAEGTHFRILEGIEPHV
jgi:hypothetical protein